MKRQDIHERTYAFSADALLFSVNTHGIMDTALYTGYIVPSAYDSMIAKILVYAPNREAAIRKMRAALNETLIIGVETNLDFQFRIMHNPVFCEGKADTGFIEKFVGGGR